MGRGWAEPVTSANAPDRAFRHFLHGVSPDGRTLAYVGTESLDGDEWGRCALWLLDLDTGAERLLGDGYSPADGPEFSPDGFSVYFNSEVASDVEGHAQLFRHDLRDPRTVVALPGDQGTITVTSWAPDGTRLAYVSHPGNP